MRELGKEGLAVTRLWLGEQTAVSYVTIKMDILVNQTLTESMCRLTLHVRCAASREYLAARRCSPHR